MFGFKDKPPEIASEPRFKYNLLFRQDNELALTSEQFGVIERAIMDGDAGVKITDCDGEYTVMPVNAITFIEKVLVD